MSLDQSSRRAIDPVALLAAFGDLLAYSDPDSAEVKAFLEAHPDQNSLVELHESARRLKQSALEQDRALRRRIAYLNQQISLKWWLLGGLIVVALVLLTVLYLQERSSRRLLERKNREMVEFANKAIYPFVYYKIPMSQHDTQSSLAIYDGLEDLGRDSPPEANSSEWTAELLYAWARSALTRWQNTKDQEHADWLAKLNGRIKYLETKYPNFGRTYALEGQIEHGLADEAKEAKRFAEAQGHYERAIKLYRQAVSYPDPEMVSVFVYSNLANALLEHGKLASDPSQQLADFEQARQAAETAVQKGKPLFLLGRETTFSTYLDTLGEIYGVLLFEAYAQIEEERMRSEKQKAPLPRALAIYTEITWNYNGVLWESIKDSKAVERYRKYADENKKRLKDARKLAEKLNVDMGPEIPQANL